MNCPYCNQPNCGLTPMRMCRAIPAFERGKRDTLTGQFIAAFDAWAAADQAGEVEDAEMIRVWNAMFAARKALAEE